MTTSEFTSIMDDSRASKIALQRYMDQYVLANDDTEATVNFISLAPQYRKRFYVPDDAVPQMMTLLNICLKEGIINHLFEVQDTNEVRATGLTFEFRFESSQRVIEFDTVVSGFLRILFRDILVNWLSFSDQREEHYCFFLATATPVYDCKSLKFKSAFRLTLPSIVLTSEIRYFVFQRVWHSVDLKRLFEDKLNYRIRECFVRSARTAPVPLLGSCEVGVPDPLYLDSVLRVDVVNGKTDGDSVTLGSIESRFPSTVNEVSVIYPAAGGAVMKTVFDPLERCLRQAERDHDDAQDFQLAYDNAYAEYVQQATMDSALEPMRTMISMLSQRRFSDRESWLEVVRSLAVQKERFYCVAVMAALDRAAELLTWEQFDKDWHAAVSSREVRAKYSPNSIRYWAERDAPSHMRRYVEETVRGMLVRDVRDSLVQGRIHHSHIASYLYFRFQNSYVTYNVTKTSVHWYEFVVPSSMDVEPGQLYKWRCIGIQPDSMFKYISRDFKDIVVKVHSDLRSMTTAGAAAGNSPPVSPMTALLAAAAQGAPDQDAKLRHAKSLFRAFDSSIVAIFNNKFKRAVVDEATGLFKRHHFIKQLDRTPHILGVGNGVLEFDGPEAALLNHYHTYPISLYTDTNYVPYDEDNKYVQTVYRMLRSLVPDDEMDALDFLLYYFSTSLDWLTKESLFLIIHGGGCHAVNTPIRMFDGSLKLVQDVRVGDRVMGDDNGVRKVLELHRGFAHMVRIQLLDEPHGFAVNRDHVLSLRFVDVTGVRFVGKGLYTAVWHRRCAEGRAPARVEIPFAAKGDAHRYLRSVMLSDPLAIDDGDVMDVMVKDYLCWDERWARHVALYRPACVEYPPQKLHDDPYEFGLWLGASALNDAGVPVPSEFMINASKHRFALLAGLMDSINRSHRYEMTLPRGRLLSHCEELIYSLGLGCSKVPVPGTSKLGRWHCLALRGPGLEQIPTRVQRYGPASTPADKLRLSAFTIAPAGMSMYYGFELDGNHRYITGDYLVHHNSNGKSVLMELFRRTLGELYARKMPLSFITDQSRTRSNSADPSVMELKDARLVYYSESDRNEKVNVAKVKEVTGGEALSGRQLYKEQENFRANCNHIVTTNHRFVIETTEHAVWRRFMSYRFKICFKHDCDPNNPTERPRDPALIDKIMNDKRYQEAFLSILVHYRSVLYARYGGQILKVPHPTIARETEEYRQSEDIFQRYIMQRVYYYKGRKQSMDDLATNFRSYYRVENGFTYVAKSADMIHTFRNTILGDYIAVSGGMYELVDLYSCGGENDSVIPGSVVFGEWIKTKTP